MPLTTITCRICLTPKLPEEMGQRLGVAEDRCKACISEAASISQAAKRARSLPLPVLRRKILTTRNFLQTLESILKQRL